MKIVFMGTPEFAVPSLSALIGAGHEIAAVVTQPDRPSGRGKVLTPPLSSGCLAGITRELALEWGAAAGLPVCEEPLAYAVLDDVAYAATVTFTLLVPARSRAALDTALATASAGTLEALHVGTRVADLR